MVHLIQLKAIVNFLQAVRNALPDQLGANRHC